MKKLYLIALIMAVCSITTAYTGNSVNLFDNVYPIDNYTGSDNRISFLNNDSDYLDLDTEIPRMDFDVQRYRQVDLNGSITKYELMEKGDAIIFNLFDNVEHRAIIDRITYNVNNSLTVRARLENFKDDYLIISTTADRSLAKIRLHSTDELYLIKSDPHSLQHYLIEIGENMTYYESGAPLTAEDYDFDRESGRLRRPQEREIQMPERPPGPNDPATINVMIVYTSAAANWANGSGGGIQNVIANTMALSQLVHDNSDTFVELDLVHSAQVDYNESGDPYADLRNMTYTTGSFGNHMQEVHEWRSEYRADLVSLLASVSSVGGLAWLLTNANGRPNLGFSLVRVQQSATGYTFVHELAHNKGCHHHFEQNFSPGPGLFSYSSGWRWAATRRECTVMTYTSGTYFPDGRTHTRVPYFSNPDITYSGVSIGDAELADNARNIREVKHVIALYGEDIILEDVVYENTNNNIPEFGQTVDVTISLRNVSLSINENFIGTLATTDEYITLVNNYANFGVISRGSTVTLENAFTIDIADNIPHNHKIDFTLTITAGENFERQTAFDTKVSSPYLTTENVVVHDPAPGGNNNGYIDPGEEISLYIPIRNSGEADSGQIIISVENDSDLVTINGITNSEFPFLVSGETVYYILSLSISEAAEEGETLLFNYRYETGGYEFSGNFSLVIGAVSQIVLGSGDNVNHHLNASPISIYFKSLRSQTVYTVAELRENGMRGVPSPIEQIGYFVSTTPLHSLPNFIIRMKHTSASDASSHDSGTLETVFQAASYQPNQGNWDMISLTTPFAWNGIDNILIDTAFSPTTDWDPSGLVRIYDAPNGMRYSRNDNIDQTDQVTGTAVDYKPQVTLIFGEPTDLLGGAPENFAGDLAGLSLQLSWDPPAEQRSGTETGSRSRLTNNDRSSITTRNPNGYNIYRNGILLNQELITELYFYDDSFDPQQTYFYYATAVYDDYESAESNIEQISFQVAAPELSVSEEIQYVPFNLEIQAHTPGANIHYTFDGEDPTTQSLLYEQPLYIEADTDLRVKAFREGWHSSETVHINYRFVPIESPQVTAEVVDNTVIRLSWSPVLGANSYIIYKSASLLLPFNEWTRVHSTGELEYQENIGTETELFFRIVASPEEM